MNTPSHLLESQLPFHQEAALYFYMHEQLFVISYQASRGRNYFYTLQRESNFYSGYVWLINISQNSQKITLFMQLVFGVYNNIYLLIYHIIGITS